MPERAVELIRQVAGALDAAHALGLVHRDVKPGNVLVLSTDAGERAYLCDFGLAKHVASVDSLTGERAFVGTIAYISPEQIEGEAVDGRADVYSLGCMLFECLTGQAPFEREREIATVYAHMNEPPPRPSDVRPGIPEGFDAVIAKALAKAPGDRFGSCGELAAAGQAALRGELLPSPPATPRPRSRRRGGGSRGRGRRGRASSSATAAEAAAQSAAPRLAIAPKTLGVIDATSHAVVARLPFASQPWDVAFDARHAWVLLGDQRRVARVDLASRKVLSSTRLPFRARWHRDRWRRRLGDRGRRARARADRRGDRANREAVLGAAQRRAALEPDRDRLRSRLGLGRARARDGARGSRRAGSSCAESRLRLRPTRSSLPTTRCGWRAQRTDGS